MEEHIAKLYNDAYDTLTIEYHNAIHELEMKKRSLEDVKERYDLSFTPFVPLPEFNSIEINTGDGVLGVDSLSPETITVKLSTEILVVEVATGNVIRTIPRKSPFATIFQDKHVTLNCPAYEETETTVRITTSNRNSYCHLFARNSEGRVQCYDKREYFLSHGQPIRRERETNFGNSGIDILRNEITGTVTALFVCKAPQELFQHRGEWYQYGEGKEGREIIHSRSQVKIPCSWEGRIHVHGEHIIHYFNNKVEILTPRP